LDRGLAELAEARRLRGGKGYTGAGQGFPSIASMIAHCRGEPKLCALLETTYFAGLRKAGVPEE
jgi:hypothetical protein